MKRLVWIALLGVALGAQSAWAKSFDDKVAGKPTEWLAKNLRSQTDVAYKAAIVREIGRQRNVEGLALLYHAAGDPAGIVRRESIHALAAFGPALADPQRDGAYLTAIQDADPDVVGAGRVALAARIQSAAEPGMEAIVRQLVYLARSGTSFGTRKAAVELLERTPPHLDAASIDTQLIETARQDNHAEVRRVAAIALGTRGVAAAKPTLVHLKNADTSEEVRLAASEALRRIGGPATTVVVAVMPFETKVPKLSVPVKDYQDAFTSALSAAQVARVVERKQIAAALTELKFQDTHIDDGKALKIGQMLRAEQVVTGVLQLAGDEVTCLSKRIDIASGEVYAAQPVVGSMHDLNALKLSCAQRLVGSF